MTVENAFKSYLKVFDLCRCIGGETISVPFTGHRVFRGTQGIGEQRLEVGWLPLVIGTYQSGQKLEISLS